MEENQQNTGLIRTTITLPVLLWNEIQDLLSDDDKNFSRFCQNSLRLKLKAIKIQNAREVLDILNDDEIEALKNELKKRQ